MFDGNQLDSSRRMAVDLKHHLEQLQAEQALASLERLGGNATYLSDLHADLASAKRAYVQAAVTEIATLHAELSEPRLG
jgi:hypothetical protein